MHRVRNFPLYPVLALLLVLGVTLGLGPAAGARTTGASQAAGAAAAARAAIWRLTIGHHSTNLRVSTSPQSIGGVSQEKSENWSGYADTGSNFTQVAGSWTEPSASCSGRTTSLAAFWVGIDGFTDATVEQDGTLIECYGGAAYQYSWWEMYPTNDIQVVGESVAAGDSITASVVRSGTSYTLAVTDSTNTANSFSTTQTCSIGCANSSAEWIAEAPSGSIGIYPLSDFGTWTETTASVTSGTTGVISSFTDYEVTMVDPRGLVKAQPGALESSGTEFADVWERSS